MSAMVVVGAQWGDEGKGKIIDYLAESADVVVRYAGGPNAGHTLVVDGKKIVVRLIPSGILRPSCQCVLAQGMVVDPALLLREIDELSIKGHVGHGRLFVSDRAHVILPHHVLADGLRESRAEPGKALGTTKRGIGPCYEDKIARRGLRLGHLRDLNKTESVIAASQEAWAPYFERAGAPMPSVAAVMDDLGPLARTILPLLVDSVEFVHDAIDAEKTILFEGAQGTLLDVDHGTYPFVTSSTAIAAGACSCSGIGPKAISKSIGISKAYTTRVGAGPFPTELDDETGEAMRRRGSEFGSVTGRSRRTGWLDLTALRFAARVNGLDSLILTKLDVLSTIGTLKVCVAYQTESGRVNRFPLQQLERGEVVKPIYEELEGWTEDLSKVRRMEDLPVAARKYIEFVERHVGLRCDLVSVGPGREETIVVRNPYEV